MPEPTPTPPFEPRWPAVAAFVTAWLCPARSARRMQHVTLPSAFAVHFATAILAFLLIICMTAIDERKTVAYELALILGELPRDWLGKIVVTGLFVLMIEGGFPVLAFLVMPWGAGDERLRSSWRNALRATWLHSTHALPMVLIVGGVVLPFTTAERNYRRTVPQPTYPAYSPQRATPKSQVISGAERAEELARMRAALAEARAQYEKALAQYEKERDAWETHKPWIAKYGPALVMWSIALCTTWVLWALLRAVGAERRLTPIAHPPTCEFCGYNLTAAPADGRCSECGELVAKSLGPDVRTGTPWERRREIGRLRTWWRCAADAILRPRVIGRQIMTRSRVTDHRIFLAMHLPVVFIMGAVWAIALFYLESSFRGQPHRQVDYEIVHAIIPFAGITGALSVLGLVTLAASGVGLIYSLSNKRNLLPATMQVASYLTAFVTIWVCFAAIVILCVGLANIGPSSAIATWASRMRLDRDFLIFLCCFTFDFPWLVVCLIALWRGTGAAQYANR